MIAVYGRWTIGLGGLTQNCDGWGEKKPSIHWVCHWVYLEAEPRKGCCSVTILFLFRVSFTTVPNARPSSRRAAAQTAAPTALHRHQLRSPRHHPRRQTPALARRPHRHASVRGPAITERAAAGGPPPVSPAAPVTNLPQLLPAIITRNYPQLPAIMKVLPRSPSQPPAGHPPPVLH